jgi:molybdopterin-binding protein
VSPPRRPADHAAITKDAADELGFAPGDAVVVIIKATEVILAKD